MPRPPVIAGILLTGLLLGWPASFAGSPSCDRSDGNLARYLLCRELSVLGEADHREILENLDRLEHAAFARLGEMKPGRRGGPVLSRLYSTAGKTAVYKPALLLADVLRDPATNCDGSPDCDLLRADCDLLGVLNYGIAERFYGAGFAASGFGLLRAGPHHLMAAFETYGNVTTVLEMTDGSIVFNPRGVFDRRSLHAVRSDTYLRLMTESEIVAMHVGSIGQRLQALGRYDEALAHFDEALALNPDEYFALRGRAEILLIRATDPLRRAISPVSGCAQGDLPLEAVETALLDQAEVAVRHSLELDGGDPHGLFLLGAIHYFDEDLRAAHDSFRTAVRGKANPVYEYYLGLTRLQLGLNRKAIKNLKASKKRQNPDPATDLALALGYRALAEQQSSYRAARKGSNLVSEAVKRNGPDSCTLVLSAELAELRRNLAHNSGFTLPRMRKPYAADIRSPVRTPD